MAASLRALAKQAVQLAGAGVALLSTRTASGWPASPCTGMRPYPPRRGRHGRLDCARGEHEQRARMGGVVATERQRLDEGDTARPANSAVQDGLIVPIWTHVGVRTIASGARPPVAAITDASATPPVTVVSTMSASATPSAGFRVRVAPAATAVAARAAAYHTRTVTRQPRACAQSHRRCGRFPAARPHPRAQPHPSATRRRQQEAPNVRRCHGSRAATGAAHRRISRASTSA